MVMAAVPVIDISPYRGIDTAARQALAAEVDRTCREIGFMVISGHGVDAGDVLFVFSNSGRNPVTIEIAAAAMSRGVAVIAVTSRRHSESIAPRGSEHRLFEIVDVVVDNGGEPGDAAIQVVGFDRAVAPTSTAVGAAIVNAIVAEAVALTIEAGVTPRVFASSNIDEGDAINALLLEPRR